MFAFGEFYAENTSLRDTIEKIKYGVLGSIKKLEEEQKYGKEELAQRDDYEIFDIVRKYTDDEINFIIMSILMDKDIEYFHTKGFNVIFDTCQLRRNLKFVIENTNAKKALEDKKTEGTTDKASAILNNSDYYRIRNGNKIVAIKSNKTGFEVVLLKQKDSVTYEEVSKIEF